ncbi:MAG: hypothetical protein KKE00_00805, partial [Proteobacteria bacterium]|nr:hypothetical protein [Pseudomonadota bacterium]
EKLLDDFSHGAIHVQHEAFRKLVALRKHNKASKDVRFQNGIDRLFKVAANSSSGEIDRLIAVSALARISFTIRGIRSKLHEHISVALKSPLPDLHLLEDVDDRAYVGKACAIACPEWIQNYASKAAVFEESGEQARRAFLIALLNSTNNLEISLEFLKRHLESYIPDTEEAGNSISRRLRRILSALRSAIAETLPETGEDPGKTLSNVIKSSFSGVSAPTSNEALIETAEEIAGVVNEIVKLRFSLATKSSTYKALNSIKSFSQSDYWERFAKKSKMMRMVVFDITEAILILARQGITDDELSNHLTTASGNSEIASEQLIKLSKRSGVSQEIKNWLVSDTFIIPKRNHAAISESKEQSDDILLSDLLVDALRFRIAEEAGRQRIISDIEILNPNISNELKRLLNYGLGLCDAIENLAKQRGLRTRGNPGIEEEYVPIEHEIIGSAAGVRKIRVVRPLVEQIRNDGISIVIRKGLVESIK